VYADNTLTPKEAVRLTALGTLVAGPMELAVLATSIRHFISHVSGPSLDVMGASLELLKYEGLVNETMNDTLSVAILSITDKGNAELHDLLTANIRTSATELNKLIIALKFRFLHLLSSDDQLLQADLLVDVCENEIARLTHLRQHHTGETGHLIQWLDHDIQMLDQRLNWLQGFSEKLTQ